MLYSRLARRDRAVDEVTSALDVVGMHRSNLYVQELAPSRGRNYHEMKLTTRMVMISASHATYGAIRSYTRFYSQTFHR